MIISEPTFDYADSKIRPVWNGTIMYLSRKGFHTLKIFKFILIWSKQIKHNTDNFFEQWKTKNFRMFIAGKYGFGYGYSDI